MNRMGKILIIDDQKAIRRALREILEFEDFQVEEAENGKEGFKKATETAFDMIFCDIKRDSSTWSLTSTDVNSVHCLSPPLCCNRNMIKNCFSKVMILNYFTWNI